MTAPVVQTLKLEAQASLVSDLNGHLQHDGFRLAMVGKLSGSPIYKIQKATLGSPADHGLIKACLPFAEEKLAAAKKRPRKTRTA